jgi:flagellar biosynthesis protein FlhB
MIPPVRDTYTYQISNVLIYILQFLVAVMVMNVWLLCLQLHVESVPITTKVVSLNPAHGKVYSIQHYVTCSRSVVLFGHFCYLHQ